MSPLLAAGLWLVASMFSLLLPARHRHRKLMAVLPLLAGLGTLLLSSSSSWPGPVAGAPGEALGRVAVGLLVLSSVSIAATLITSPRLEGGEIATLGVVAAATVVLLGASTPVTWSAMVAIAMGAVALRWILMAPGTSTLATGRVAGLGAALLIAVSPFLPITGSLVGPWPVLVGSLLAVATATLLGLLPMGGWAVGAIQKVAPMERLAWTSMLAPAILITISLVPDHLPEAARLPLQHYLLVGGLVSAAWAGINAIRTPLQWRYARIHLGDLALGAAGLGSTHPLGRLGLLVLLLSHLLLTPLLLQPPRRGLRRIRLLGWVALSGIPPSLIFWGRLLVLLACSNVGSGALAAALVGTALLSLAAVQGALTEGKSTAPHKTGDHLEPRVALGVRAILWAVAIVTVAASLLPNEATQLIFGQSLSVV